MVWAQYLRGRHITIFSLIEGEEFHQYSLLFQERIAEIPKSVHEVKRRRIDVYGTSLRRIASSTTSLRCLLWHLFLLEQLFFRAETNASSLELSLLEATGNLCVILLLY